MYAYRNRLAGSMKYLFEPLDILLSRQNPKILWVDDTEVVGDRIAQLRPVFRSFFAQEFERGVGDFAIGGVGLVVREMLVHHAP